MKFYQTPLTLLATCFLLSIARPVSASTKERMGPAVRGGSTGSTLEKFDAGGRATENRTTPPPTQTPLILDGRDHDHSCGGDSMHHQLPCEMDVDSSGMMPPTDAPGSSTGPPATSDPGAPTDPPSSIGGRTDPPSDAPGETGEPCESANGTFGEVSGTPQTDVSVNYMYEMETAPGVTRVTIDTVILPSLEKAIVDSVLQEAFPDECPSISTEIGKRRLRRRLAVTGITMNPPDMVNEEFVCDSSAITDPANGCSVIDGELTLYTTDGQATDEEEKIQQLIRESMNSGAYNSVSDDIVRLVYLDTPSPPESNTGDGSSGTDGTDGTSGRSNQLRVGLFVGLFGGAAILAGVLFRARRKRNVDDETDIQTNGASALQPADSQSGIISLEDSGGMLSQSYDDSGMVMADTGMDSASSDGLGIAA